MLFITKYLPIIALSSVLSASCQSKKSLTLKIEYLQPYCGGARPTPEMEKDAQTPKPFANKMIIFVSSTGKIDSAKTDAKGTLKKKLSIGTYKLYETWKHYRSTPDGSSKDRFDKECLSQEWTKEFANITITKKTITRSDGEYIVNYCDHMLPCLLETHKPPMRE